MCSNGVSGELCFESKFPIPFGSAVSKGLHRNKEVRRRIAA